MLFRSVSIQDFWKRWHITLSSWILDYLFKPLQIKWRNYGDYGLVASLVVTFLICGLWHGLTVNYIIWGMFHGLFISLSYLTNKKWLKFCKKNLNDTITYLFDVTITFNVICFSWLIFRISKIDDLFLIVKKILSDLVNFSVYLRGHHIGFSPDLKVLFIVYVIIELLRTRINFKQYIDDSHIVIRWALYYAVLFSILNYSMDDTEFIYMQF